MLKVKIFTGYGSTVEENMNKWLKEKDNKDIDIVQLSHRYDDCYCSVLILYR